MKKLTGILVSLVLATVFALSSNSVFASGVECQPIYGGGQTCIGQGDLTINKMVQNPQTGGFVDSLSVTDPRFSPDQNITFQISVANPGNAILSQVTITDTFPAFVNFVSGPGNFNNSTRQLVFQISDLKPGETRTFTVVGKIATSGSLPSNQAITCDVNQSLATANGKTAQDNSQFCIEKQVTVTKGGLPILPVPQKQFQAPPTGPEMLPLIGLIPAGLGGFMLRRKTNKFGGAK